MAFANKGDAARWRIIYNELLSTANVGDLLTYEALGQVLDLDPLEHRAAIQGAIQRAATEFLVECKQSLDVVPNVGYVVVDAEKHLDIARHHHRKASNSLRRGHAQVANLDLSSLPEDLRKVAGVMVVGFSAQMEFNKRFEAGQDRMQQVLDTVTVTTERTADEVAEVRARIARLEAELREARPADED